MSCDVRCATNEHTKLVKSIGNVIVLYTSNFSAPNSVLNIAHHVYKFSIACVQPHGINVVPEEGKRTI